MTNDLPPKLTQIWVVVPYEPPCDEAYSQSCKRKITVNQALMPQNIASLFICFHNGNLFINNQTKLYRLTICRNRVGLVFLRLQYTNVLKIELRSFGIPNINTCRLYVPENTGFFLENLILKFILNRTNFKCTPSPAPSIAFQVYCEKKFLLNTQY